MTKTAEILEYFEAELAKAENEYWTDVGASDEYWKTKALAVFLATALTQFEQRYWPVVGAKAKPEALDEAKYWAEVKAKALDEALLRIKILQAEILEIKEQDNE